MPDLKGRHLHGEKLSTSPSMDSSRRARLPGAVGAQDHRPAAQIGVGVTCAVDGDAGDPLLLGQRVVAVLETRLRTATYKLAILMALIGRLWCGARLLATMSPVTTLSP